MGRPEIEIDEDVLFDLLTEGNMSKKDMAVEFAVSPKTISNKIKKLQERHSVVTQYRAVQHLELTEIQSQILDAITPEKIESATLPELVTAFKILKDKELVVEGKPSEIKGLVGYLVQLEKEEAALKKPPAEVIDLHPEEEDETEDFVPDF